MASIGGWGSRQNTDAGPPGRERDRECPAVPRKHQARRELCLYTRPEAPGHDRPPGHWRTYASDGLPALRGRTPDADRYRPRGSAGAAGHGHISRRRPGLGRRVALWRQGSPNAEHGPAGGRWDDVHPRVRRLPELRTEPGRPADGAGPDAEWSHAQPRPAPRWGKGMARLLPRTRVRSGGDREDSPLRSGHGIRVRPRQPLRISSG